MSEIPAAQPLVGRDAAVPGLADRALPWLRRGHAFVALILYTGMVLVLSNPLILHLNDRIIGPAQGDNLYEVWLLWWFRKAMESGLDPAYTHYIFALVPSVQVFVDTGFDEALGWPLQWLMSPVGAYDLVVLLSFILSGLTMYFLAGEFVESRVACFVAGCLYTFSTFHFARAAGHMGLLTIQWLPFCAWRTFAFYRRPTLTNAALAGLALALVPLSEVYYLPYFAFPFLALFVIWKLSSDRGWFACRRNLLLTGFAILLTGFIAGTPLASSFLRVDPDMQAQAQLTARQGLEPLSADLLAFVLPSSDNPLFGGATRPVYDRMKSPWSVEKSVFLGYPLLGLAALAFAVRRNRNRTTAFWLGTAAVGIILALGPRLIVAGQATIPLPAYNLAFGWPMLSNFRAPNRLVVLPLTALAVLAAYGVDSIRDRLSSDVLSRLAFGAMMCALVGLTVGEDVVGGAPLPTAEMHVSPLYTRIAADTSGGLLLDLPLVTEGYFNYLQTIHHHPLVYGLAPRMSPRMLNSVQNVPGLMDFQSLVDSSAAAKQSAQNGLYPTPSFKNALETHGIRYVVFHLTGNATADGTMRLFLRQKLGSPFYDSPEEGLMAWRLQPATGQSRSYEVDLGSGWLLQPGSSEVGSLGAQGDVYLYAPRPSHRTVRIDAQAFFRPLTMEAWLNGVPVATIAFRRAWTYQYAVLAHLSLHTGRNTLLLKSTEGCKRPSDYDPRSADTRCFSFEVRTIRMDG